MKNLNKYFLLTLILLFLINKAMAQKIEIIDHGQLYLDLKEMGYYDFKDNCRKIYIGNTKFPQIMSVAMYSNRFAGSIFPNKLNSNKYFSDLEKLSKEFGSRVDRSLYTDFDECSKKAYEYVQLYLQKFEVISEYYKELHNYNLDKQNERVKIANRTEEVSNSITTDKNKSKEKIHSDNELNKLIAEKRKALSKINSNFENKIEQVEFSKQGEIKGLQMSNYAENKRKIIDKYEPKISALKKQKDKDRKSAKLFWDDKINDRKRELEKIVASEISELEKTKVQMQSSQRQEIKSQNNLNQKREEIETNYQNAISEINEKIKVLLEK